MDQLCLQGQVQCLGTPHAPKISELLGGKPDYVIVSSYVIDQEWVEKMVPKESLIVWIKHSDGAPTKRSGRHTYAYPNVSSGIMHAKFMILVHEHHLRVIITSANWRPFEFHHLINMVYYQDFLEGVDQGSQFSQVLLPFLYDLGVPDDIFDHLKRFDYTTSLGCVITSQPGVHTHSMGLHRLTALIETMCIPRDNLSAYYQTTNLGFLDKEWYEFMKGVSTMHTQSTYAVLYPSFRTVRKLHVDRNHTEILHSNLQLWKTNTYCKQAIKDCIPTVPKILNSNLLFCTSLDVQEHIQLGGETSDGYLILGSHQHTRNAWGRPTSKGLDIKNWELSIMIPFVKASTEGFVLPFTIRDYKTTDEPFEFISHSHKISPLMKESWPESFQTTANAYCCICKELAVDVWTSQCPQGHVFHSKCLNQAFVDPFFNQGCPQCKSSNPPLPHQPKLHRPVRKATFLDELTPQLFYQFLTRLENTKDVEKVRKELHFAEPGRELLLDSPMTIFKELDPLRVYGYLFHYPELVLYRDEIGYQPLHWAAGMGNFHICLLLVRFHAPLDQPDPSGSVPLHRAAEFGHLSIVKLLYKECPRAASLTNARGWTPIEFATRNHFSSVVEFLKSMEPKIKV
jgi:hypothetical protein